MKLKTTEHDTELSDQRKKQKHPIAVRVLGTWLRFSGWFLGFSGLLALGTSCPFCGNQGCPTGNASVGFIGLVLASCMQWGKLIIRKISNFLCKRR